MNHEIYQSPLSERYASKEMQYVFSPEMKFKTWRRLWIALAETEQELGLDITDEQIAELKAAKDDINYDVAKKREKEVHVSCLCLRTAVPEGKGDYPSGCHIMLCWR